MSERSGAGDGPSKAGPELTESVDEVQGVFPSDAALQDAMARLAQAGFDRADLSLPHATGDGAHATPEQGAANPTTDDDRRQQRTLQGSLGGAVGAMAAAGVTIATGGAALPAVIAAAAGGLGIGGLVSAAGNAAGSMQGAARDQAAAAGSLVLSARVISAERAQRAEATMREAGATQVERVARTDSGTTPVVGTDSASWTGG